MGRRTPDPIDVVKTASAAMAPTESHPTDTDLHCPECDYNLTGATGAHCPWCGWTIDEAGLVSRAPAGIRRFGVIVACLVCCIGSLVAVVSLMGHGRTLTIRDGLAVVGVSVAALGHLALAGLLIASEARRPLRRTEVTQLIHFAGWFSIVAGVLGATGLLQPRLVLGTSVTSVFDFTLAAAFFSLPGWALLGMYLVSFSGNAAPKMNGAAAEERLESARAPFYVEWFRSREAVEVTQAWDDRPRGTTPAIEAAIHQAWEAQTALARAEGRTLFDGELIRLVRSEVAPTRLRLALGPTRYREFVGTHFRNHELLDRFDETHRSNALGISAAVVTSDGYVAFGRRSGRVAYHAGLLHPFGGMLDLTDRASDGDVGFEQAITRELREEIGVEPWEISEITLIGLVRDRTILQPELIFDVILRRSRSELDRRFDSARAHGEHTAIEFLHDKPEAFVPSLNWAGRSTPVAEAAYLLHGRRQWGQEWYENTCYLRYGELPAAWPVTNSAQRA